MKLTPLDIHHKEFRHSLRGYSEEEVDEFLDLVADEFERLFKENIDLSEKLEAANDRLREYQDQEHTIRNTMIAAQRSADDIVTKAREEATAVLRDAEMKAKEIIHNALTQKQKVQNELVRIKQAEEDFRARFRGLLETHVQSLAEIRLPDDVNVLMGQTEEGVVGEVEIASAAPVAAPGAEPAPVAERVAAPTPAAPESSAQAPVVTPVEEPPASGFVESMTFGEVEGPEIADDEPELIGPKEFQLRPFDQLGERDDDLDIEEID